MAAPTVDHRDRTAWTGAEGQKESPTGDLRPSAGRLFAAVDELLDTLGMPGSLKEAGVDEAEFAARLPELAMAAFEDMTIRTNPRMPLVSEITDLLRESYAG